jgi:8-oxo-dGTP pyrophosphatase MutT (NUDIX family)
MEPALPKRASTVILVRPSRDANVEILLTRRPEWMEFLGGFYVFPGGIVEEEDWSPQMIQRCRGLAAKDAQAILGNDLSPEHALGHWIGAIRELFEESGVLLGVTEAGAPLDFNSGGLETKLQARRRELVERMTSLQRILEGERLYCDASRLIYFMHRVTPETNPVRFDTRFYLARLPSTQIPLSESEEVAESVWINPAKALTQCDTGDIPMIRPTRIVLQRLADFHSWESLSKAHRLG